MIQDFLAKLTEKKHLVGDVWQLRFEIPEGQELHFLPGQYLLLKIGENYRQYSISSPNTDIHGFEIIIEYVPGGLASTYLAALPVGEAAHFKGPAGIFLLNEDPIDKIFLATGTGIAPIKSMIESCLSEENSPQLQLFFGLKSYETSYLFENFKTLAQQHANFHFKMCLSRQESFDNLDPDYFMGGHVQAGLDRFLEGENIADFEYYLCGSKDIVSILKEYVLEKGVPKERIFSEKFTV